MRDNMSLSNWLHRRPVYENLIDNDGAYALSNRVRDPFSDAFSELVKSMARLDNEFGTLHGLGNNKFLASFPTYEVDASGDKYKLMVDVPGVRAEDMKVELEEDGKIVHISGGRKFEKDGITTESHFEKRFTLRDSVDTSGMTARLEHGVLVLEAPMQKEAQPKKRIISVTEALKQKDAPESIAVDSNTKDKKSKAHTSEA